MSAAGLGPIHLVPDLEGQPAGGLAAYARGLNLPGQRLLDPAGFRREPPPNGVLILHCSGYGYAANGAPLALAGALIAWRQAATGRRLLVIFHELDARQPPWRKGFWWGPLQRRVLRRLGRAADGCLTTLERHDHWLRRQGIAPAAVVPVPSNVGELRSPAPLCQRQPRLVVFGGPAQRQAAYRALARQPAWLRGLALEGIDDIGAPLAAQPQLPLPLQCHGRLAAEQVSHLLASAAAAAVAYPLDFLAKSGIFAAIAAHGSLPVLLPTSAARARTPVSADGLAIGRHLIAPTSAPRLGACHGAALQAIATAAWRWYQPHRLSEQRRRVQAWIDPCAVGSS